MKRREFLISVGAVPVAVYFAGLPEITEAVVERATTPIGLQPWQLRIWAALERGKDVIYVTSTQVNAWRVFNLFKRHKKLFCTSINGALYGRRADLIIMDDFVDDIDPDWFNSCIRTRLTRNGKVDWAYT
ncbi:hypothetical protein LCGC14_0481430 [marine sediment metagenome]|uniref:Uncharacterized protein n=1 Tax=marine sediment metagenome TaxID=412755 RepID=A0A0F9VHY8_9ZZZZ